MDLSAISPALLIASLMVAATPLLLAAIGELVVEKAGVLNLGVEGMMITGAVVGFAVAVNTTSPMLGFVAAAIAGAARSIHSRLCSRWVCDGCGVRRNASRIQHLRPEICSHASSEIPETSGR